MNTPVPTQHAPPLRAFRQIFTSWSLVVPLLFICGLIAGLGIWIPQAPIAQIRLSESLPEWSKAVILGLQLNDVYRSPIFLIPLLMLFLSLVNTGVDRVWPRLSQAWSPERHTPDAETWQSLSPVALLGTSTREDLHQAFFRQGYRLRHADGEFSYLDKGALSRLAALLAHGGLLLLLLGAVVSLLTAAKGHLSLQPGESRPLAEALKAADYRGRLTPDFAGITLKLVQQRDHGGNEAASLLEWTGPAAKGQGEVYPDHGLNLRGLHLYQAGVGVGGLEVSIGAQKKSLPLRQIPAMNASITPFQEIGDAKVTFFADPGGDVYLFDGERQPIGVTLAAGQQLQLEDQQLVLEALDPRQHSLRLRIGTAPARTLNLRKVPQMQTMEIYVTPFQTIGSKKFTFVFSQAQPDQILLFDDKFQPLILPLGIGESRIINHQTLRLLGRQTYSELLFTYDGGAPILLLGLGALVLSLMLAQFGHREIWLRQVGGQWHFAGRASKAPLAFGLEWRQALAQSPLTPARKAAGS